MKKIDLGQTLSITANVGVIGGIFFLAYELNKNNRSNMKLMNKTLA